MRLVPNRQTETDDGKTIMTRKKLYVLSAVSGAVLAGLAGTATLAHEGQGSGDRDGRRAHQGMQHDGKGWKGHYRFHGGHFMQGRGGMHGGLFSLLGGRHVDGMLAFAKTEIEITEAQEPQWNAFANAVRGSAERMRALRDETRAERKTDGEADSGERRSAQRLDLTERLDRMEARTEAHLQTLKEVNAALKPLYASLSDEQKETVRELMRHRRHARR